jgi:hypothetical protein
MVNLSMENVLPSWLSAPDPEPVKVSQQTKELILLQYENVFMRVISEIAKGKTLAHILNTEDRQIDYNDFYRWLKKDPERLALYQEAQELRTEFFAGEIVQIADGDDIEDVHRSRLRIETRRWLMGVHNRKRYGETKTIEMNTNISITDALAQAQQRVLAREMQEVIEGEVVNSSDSPGEHH